MSATENFLPIQSLDIETEKKITFNLYVNLPLNNKYILYRRAGGVLESDKLEKLTDANVSNFFIEKKDYNEFVKYVALRINSMVGGQDSVENRRMMATTTKAILSSTIDQTDPSIAMALLGNLNDITGAIIENALERTQPGSKKLLQKLSELAAKGSDFQRHPVNVTSLAVLITFGIGYNSEKILSDIAMASLLHDLGLSKIPAKMIPHAHNLLRLGIYEREWLYRHPELAIEIIEDKNIPVSELTKTIILQHHEEFNGSGYPAKLRGYSINELPQILRVADEIDLLFNEVYLSPGHLRIRVAELLLRFADKKIVEPLLLSRIRKVLF